jgi:hypothetical protein
MKSGAGGYNRREQVEGVITAALLQAQQRVGGRCMGSAAGYWIGVLSRWMPYSPA